MAHSIPTRSQMLRKGVACFEWRNIALLNYPVKPEWLLPLLPAGTELDLYEGSAWVSLVGLTYKNVTRRGLTIPTQQDFQRVNLRFYVRRRSASGVWRRGIVVMKDFVPKLGLAWTGRLMMNKQLTSVPVTRCVEFESGHHGICVTYSWKWRTWQSLSVHTSEWEPREMERDSAAEFFAHRPWGYVAQRDGSTVELRIKYPRWRVYPVRSVEKKVSGTFCGRDIETWLPGAPHSVLLAEGSEVRVRKFSKLDVPARRAS